MVWVLLINTESECNMKTRAAIRFTKRLKALGVEAELVMNYPWVYLHSVNGVLVKEKYYSNWHFTAFLKGGEVFYNRRKVFDKIREMLLTG